MYFHVTDLGQFLSALRWRPRSKASDQARNFGANVDAAVRKAEEKTGFGIGFHISQLDGHRVIGHGGDLRFATEVAGLP